MKSRSLIFLAATLALSLDTHSVEPKQMKDVNAAALTAETQKVSTVNGIHLAWWIPPEFWEASVSQRQDVPASSREAIVKSMRGYSMLAITQGESSPFGNITFYDRETIIKGAKIEVNAGKGWNTISPTEKVPEDLQQLIKVMSPMLEASLGKLGQNLQFFVLDDEVKGARLMSPYGHSSLRVTLTDKRGTPVTPFMFEMPLDALYVPRMCPNGRPAHVSWVVCPWDGSKLPE
jgi:hypothetical protein